MVKGAVACMAERRDRVLRTATRMHEAIAQRRQLSELMRQSRKLILKIV